MRNGDDFPQDNAFSYALLALRDVYHVVAALWNKVFHAQR